MNNTEAVEYLSGLVDHERQPPLARELTLEPIRQLLGALGNPQQRLKIVHVTGTKGKGSVSSMLERTLRGAGFRTGLYTSPDLTGFEERVRVSGKPITSAELDAVVRQIRGLHPDQLQAHPTRFDVATALAFLHFATQQVDIAVIEVGMGGRTDSTNVCDPVLSIITNVSLDHTRQLGATVAAIASEKAGIIKPGRPVVTGATGDALDVIRTVSRQQNSPLRVLGRDFSCEYRVGPAPDCPGYVRVATGRVWPELTLALRGQHQAENAALVVAAVEQLREAGWTIPDAAVVQGLRDVEFPARIEVVGRSPLVILDCAHNVASAQALVETLQRQFPAQFGVDRGSSQRWLVFGSSWDKDLTGVLGTLVPHFDRICLTQYTRSTRCATLEDLRAAIRSLRVSVPVEENASASAAWRTVQQAARPQDAICITGSVFLAGELRDECRNT